MIQAEVGLDTEGSIEKPWGLSYSHHTGQGFVGIGPFQGEFLEMSILHNYMWDQQVLQTMGISLDEDRFHDTQIMAYLLGIEPQGLKALALRHLGIQLKDYEEVVGTWVQELTKTGKPKKKKTFVLGTLDDIPLQDAINYAGADADVTRQLKPILWQKLVDANLTQVYEQDRRMLPVYARMEHVGMPVSVSHFKQFGEFLDFELARRTFDLQERVGPDFNPGSPDQVAKYLFEDLGLSGSKKTKSGKRYTTNDKILQALKGHEAVQAIIDWREIQKLKTTFVDSLPQYCKPARDGHGVRLHARLLPTRVVTGRLAAKSPNVLALPKHSDLGKRFRAGIRAEPGRLLGSWDFDQIELRVLALDSASIALREIFTTGQDLHARTAQRLFQVPPELQDKSKHRLPAKAVNFGIPMGMTEMGLAEQYRKNGYHWPELEGIPLISQDAQYKAQADVCRGHIKAVIEDWGIGPYLEEKKAQARRYGYVTDMWGRRRYLPSCLSPNKQIREEALRQAQSFPIQAGARGFYKTVVSRVWRDVIKPLQAEGYYIEPLLDIHDDLLLEFQADMARWLVPLIESYFNGTFNEVVPITCKGSVGVSWDQL